MSIRTHHNSSRGFTIVELLIVIIVIAILAAITIIAYNGATNRAKASAAQTAIQQGVNKIMVYSASNGDAYPTDLASAGITNNNGATYQYEVRDKGYCLTALVQGITYFQTNASAAPQPGTCVGLIAWWPFNGDASDDSGNGLDATIVGATAATGQSGQANGAYALGETNQYITAGTPSNFNTLPSGFTYSVWVSNTTPSTYQWPVIMGAGNTHIYFGIRATGYGASAMGEFGTSPFTGSTWSSLGAKSLAPLNSWHHLAMEYDGTTVRWYVDGVYIYGVASSPYGTMSALLFGTSTNGWNGKVDDARVYNRALTSDEIQTIYNTGAL